MGAGLLLSLICLCSPGAGHAQAADGKKTTARVGRLTIEVGWDRKRQEVVIRRISTYTLTAHSKATAELRNSGYGSRGGYKVLRDGKGAENDGWDNPADKVTQTSPDGLVHVKSSFALYLSRQSGEQNLTIVFTPDTLTGTGEQPEGYPTVWLLKVSAPKWSFGNIRGPVESQSADTVVWRVRTAHVVLKKTAAVTRSVALSRSLTTTLPPTSRHQTRGELLAAFALAVCGIGVVASLLVARLAGPAVPRRWAAATMLLSAAVCVSALFDAVAPQLPSNVVHFYVSSSSRISPESIWTPGSVLGVWLWYVLPVAGWWFSRRAVTGRPPSWRVLLLGSASLVLSFLLMAAGGTVPTPRGWLFFAMVVPLALSVALVLFLSGNRARNWAFTAGALLWIFLAALLFGRAPVMAVGSAVTNNWKTAAVLVCTWPAAAWLTSLLAPVLRRAVGPVTRTACFVVLWGTLVPLFFVFPVAMSSHHWRYVWGFHAYPFFTGYADLPLFVVAVCGVALQIAYLLRRGTLGDGGRAGEPVGRVLLVCAALMALGSPGLRTLSMWGSALAVLWVALASLVLIPIGSSVTAAKFRRVSREAHARFMDRWLTTQLVWDTRADFQRVARSELTKEMTVPQFSDRWSELGVPGHIGDPAKRLARAKRFALGSSAGAAPGAAGLACAGLAQLLALPWATYELVTSGPVGGAFLAPFHLDELSKALRFGHWALYGFVYGYFYALLRGLTPIGKATVLMLVLAPAEILPLVTLTVDPQYTWDPSWTDMAATCGAVAGQTFVVCMGLGLCWEWWLARAAGMKWSQVRNFRRLSSVTVPAGTVLVAGATAFATAVAGSWAQPGDNQPPPGGQPSQSASETPGAP
ncbi:hypothetical protein [Streptomyces sp. NBC_00151]|uniref:hypothetical protein n=1 Tax=Streptomyces sp. NBC_00151 TaxID=2975669 RepID=UPI002DD98409|nr:hypothetical protein [Streptomyces sp. NBC_00151]WRZ39934.1 hypothetical protein OG915_18935 [Streptomyces sp. NBC_00151]